MTPAHVANAKASPRSERHVLGKLLLLLLGLGVGLFAAELIFRFRDGAGFSKLNLYRPDPDLGVRLIPGATQRLVYPDNPPTNIRINGAGYRGADFPAPGSDDLAVVGDSQVFGLGVEEDETFAAVLGQKLEANRHVLNAGIPTYGPAEYAAVAREMIAKHHVKTVVFTVNLVNDLFEATRPNRGRHVVRDGWAVRAEAAEPQVEFPGRTWLARHSHLFYAIRQLWHRDSDGTPVASEGTWQDLVASGSRSSEQAALTQQQRKERTAVLRQTEDELSKRTAEIDRAMLQLLSDELTTEDQIALDAAHRLPGDLVEDPFSGAEEARPVTVTAAQIRSGAVLRAKLRDKLLKLAKAQPRGKEREAILASLTAQPKLATKLNELGAAQIRAVLETPLAPILRDLKRDCDEHGVRLVLLILPIDVAVAPQEWKKYRAAPIDMSSVASLSDELLELGAELGVSTLEATAVLRAAEPGAFLNHDIHMTPRGHRAVAAALADTLAAAPPQPRRATELSPLPLPAQWNAATEITVPGSTAANCETKIIREWLRILCLPHEFREDSPTAITVDHDPSRAALVMVMPGSAALVMPLARGQSGSAQFQWTDSTRTLSITWPAEKAEPSVAFSAPTPHPSTADQGRAERPFASEAARDICACWGKVYPPSQVYFSPERPACPGIYGDADPRCAAYRDACAEMVACVLRDPSSPPVRPPEAAMAAPPAAPVGAPAARPR
jgi:SGNH hydrolase-like domain, acetyltransferase AlgX